MISFGAFLKQYSDDIDAAYLADPDVYVPRMVVAERMYQSGHHLNYPPSNPPTSINVIIDAYQSGDLTADAAMQLITSSRN